MTLNGVCKYIYVGFVLKRYGCNRKQVCSHVDYLFYFSYQKVKCMLESRIENN